MSEMFPFLELNALSFFKHNMLFFMYPTLIGLLFAA